jgi:hypothetical protein
MPREGTAKDSGMRQQQNHHPPPKYIEDIGPGSRRAEIKQDHGTKVAKLSLYTARKVCMGRR